MNYFKEETQKLIPFLARMFSKYHLERWVFLSWVCLGKQNQILRHFYLRIITIEEPARWLCISVSCSCS
jgi:hypothetical protein